MNRNTLTNNTNTFDLLIILSNDLISDDYTCTLLKHIHSTINPLTNKCLSWTVYDCRKQLNRTVLDKYIIRPRSNIYTIPNLLVFLCATESIANKTTLKVAKEIIDLKLAYSPFIICLTSNKNDKESDFEQLSQKLALKNDDKDDFLRQISKIYHNDEKDVTKLLNKLFEICSYYNQLGDKYKFPGEINNDYDYPDIFTLNLLFVGRPGTGKSLLINILFNEMKALSRSGLVATSDIIKYHHEKYPLVIYDSPGIGKNQISTIVQCIKNRTCNNKTLSPKEQIHAIVYFINSQSPRDGKEYETQLFKEINSTLNDNQIPIFFLITHSNENDKIETIKTIYNSIINKPISNKNLYMVNLRNPYLGIGFFVEGVFSSMLSNPLFLSYLSNPKLILVESVFNSAKNQIFEHSLRFKPVRSKVVMSLEVKTLVYIFLKEIYAIYNLEMNEEWNKLIEMTAQDSYKNINLRNNYITQEIFAIKRSIRVQIDLSNYLTHIAISAYQTIEQKIKFESILLNIPQIAYNSLCNTKEEFTQELVNKYHS